LIIDNPIVYWYLVIILFCGVIGGFVRILAPNWISKRYIAGTWKLPSDNGVRLFGIIFLSLSFYVLSWVFGWIQ